MYAGMSGNTHGEIKLTNPDKKASKKEIDILVKKFSKILRINN